MHKDRRIWLRSALHLANGRAEGVAVVILKRLDVRGTPWLHHRSPYARLLGIATNSDGAEAQGGAFPAGSAMSALASMVRPRTPHYKTVRYCNSVTMCLPVMGCECTARAADYLMLYQTMSPDSTGNLLVMTTSGLCAGLQRQQDQEG
jgi:hypothetical protein